MKRFGLLLLLLIPAVSLGGCGMTSQQKNYLKDSVKQSVQTGLEKSAPVLAKEIQKRQKNGRITTEGITKALAATSDDIAKNTGRTLSRRLEDMPAGKGSRLPFDIMSLILSLALGGGGAGIGGLIGYRKGEREGLKRQMMEA